MHRVPAFTKIDENMNTWMSGCVNVKFKINFMFNENQQQKIIFDDGEEY